jgi:hypothetical protein
VSDEAIQTASAQRPVITALVAVIHVLAFWNKGVDGRVKPGHDGERGDWIASLRSQ